jgi:hypothetical protein
MALLPGQKSEFGCASMKSMNEEEWGTLWQQAWVAYQDYIAKANDTFQLISNLKFPVSVEKRVEILNVRGIENGARERLQIARNTLFTQMNRSEIPEIHLTAGAG